MSYVLWFDGFGFCNSRPLNYLQIRISTHWLHFPHFQPTDIIFNKFKVTMSSKKYKLFKASDDGKAVPCAFFASAEGCRGGDKCRFLHELPSAPKREHVAAAVSVKRERAASVVSSESEGEGAGAISPPPVASATKASAKAKAPIAIVKEEEQPMCLLRFARGVQMW
jgi:hypothetical protein